MWWVFSAPVFASTCRFTPIAVADLALPRPSSELWETIAFLFCFPSLLYIHLSRSHPTLSLSLQLVRLSFPSNPPPPPLPTAPWCSSSADTHEQPSRTRSRIMRPSGACVGAKAFVNACVCVLRPAESSDAIGTKLDQFVKSREVQGLEEQPGATFKVNRGVWVKTKGISRMKPAPHTQQTSSRRRRGYSINAINACIYVEFDRERSRPQCWRNVCVCGGVCVCVQTTARPTLERQRLIIKEVARINYQLLARMNQIKKTMSRRGHRASIYWTNDECVSFFPPASFLSSPGLLPLQINSWMRREEERETEGERWEWHILDSLTSKAMSLSRRNTQTQMRRLRRWYHPPCLCQKQRFFVCVFAFYSYHVRRQCLENKSVGTENCLCWNCISLFVYSGLFGRWQYIKERQSGGERWVELLIKAG